MNKRILAAALALFMMLLSGCQLAKENLQQTPASDRLIGVFLTREHLDLFDMDRYMEDHISDLLNDGVIESGGAEYQGKLYAEATVHPSYNTETGESSEYIDYTFGDVDGISYFACIETIPETGERPPFLTFAAVRAIAPVAGIPPNNPEYILPTP